MQFLYISVCCNHRSLCVTLLKRKFKYVFFIPCFFCVCLRNFFISLFPSLSFFMYLFILCHFFLCCVSVFSVRIFSCLYPSFCLLSVYLLVCYILFICFSYVFCVFYVCFHLSFVRSSTKLEHKCQLNDIVSLL
jgi:hypothetical protein